MIFFVIGVKVSFKQSEYSVGESAGRVAITIQAARRYYTSFYVKIRASVHKNLRPYGKYEHCFMQLHTLLYICTYVYMDGTIFYYK